MFKKSRFWLILVLIGIFLLRLPSFFEPYWYGDEGIYLAIGQAVQRGAVLYRDIWDNKTPLLYLIYAIHPTLLWAKISATAFVLATVFLIYKLSLVILGSKTTPESLNINPLRDPGRASLARMTNLFSLATALVTGIFLSLPLLEGTIANAELYFALPIVLGAYLIFKFVIPANAGIYTNRFRVKPGMTVIVGLLASVAFLLKVPALFDFLGMFVYMVIVILSKREGSSQSAIARFFTSFRMTFAAFLPIMISFLLPILGFFVYFYFQHALSDYLVAAFSQNASYVAVDTGPLSKLSNPLFTKGLLLLLSLLILLVLFVKKRISKELLFLSLWFGFSLYGALLSGRPYMHYLLQIVPPLVLLIAYVLANLKKYWWSLVPLYVILYTLYSLFRGAFFLPNVPYYQNWFDYVSERKSWADYVSFFDNRTLNSYNIASYVIRNTSPSDKIFVWGDAAFVYVLSNRPPATKFIQAHHLTTIDPINYQKIIDQLVSGKTKFILVSRPGHFAFPALEELLKKNYSEVAVFQDMHVYKII